MPEPQLDSSFPPEGKPPPVKPRINVIEQVFWQGPDAKPILSETRIGYMIDNEEEPYQRNNIRVDLPWEQIDLGWVKDKPISQIVLINSGKDTDATIEVGIKVPNHNWIIDFASIKPGRSQRIETPTQPTTFYVRSRHKVGRYSIRVFPL